MTIPPIRRLTAIVAAGALITLVGCGGDKPDTAAQGIHPAERGPVNAAGQATCVYIEDDDECEDSGVDRANWFQAPADEPQPVAGSDMSFLTSVWLFHLMYMPWFSSPAYVNRYVDSDRRDRYTTRVDTTKGRYADRINAAKANARYKDGTGAIVTGDKANPERFRPPAANNGGDRGRKVCNVLVWSLGRFAPPPAPPKPAAPAPPARQAPPAQKAPDKAPPVGGDRGKGGAGIGGC